MSETLDEDALKAYRGYLQFQARVLVSPWLRNHLDLSGLIDEALLKAWQGGERLRAMDEGSRAAWLRAVLGNRVRDEIAKLRADCRDVRRNRSLDESSARLEAVLQAPQSSPSEVAERHEQERRLAEAVERLPEAQREALVLQRWHGWSLEQIAEQMGRSPGAVAGLLHRAMKQLKQDLTEPE